MWDVMHVGMWDGSQMCYGSEIGCWNGWYVGCDEIWDEMQRERDGMWD